MGVNGLWKVLEPCADYSQTLPQLAASHYSSSTSQHRGLRVGIDISIWLVASKEVFSSTEGDLGPNPALRDLFFKLCRLLRAGVLPLLVFDGRSKPKFKRGRTTHGTGFDPASTLNMKELIEIFGMEWIEAAGEAEAELAELETAGILDAVVTLDSDFFVFGGRTLIKNTNLTQEEASLKRQEKEALAAAPSSPIKDLPSTSLNPPPSPITLQSASQKASEGVKNESSAGITTVYTGLAVKLGLDRQSLILFVLLTGGDYHDGIKGLGPESALRIIKAGLGEAFWIEAERRKTGEVDFETWRESAAQELENRASGRRSQKGADLMRASIDFPSLQVLNDYDCPALSKCEKCGATWSEACGHRKQPDWNRDVDLKGLVEFCSQHFEWHSSQIVDRFRKNLWVGLVMQKLRLERLKVDLIRWKKKNPLESPPPTLTFSDSSPLSTLLHRCHKYSESSTYLPASGLPSYQLSLNQDAFLAQLKPLLLTPDPRALTAEQLAPTILIQGVLPHPKKEFPLISEKPSELRHWFGKNFLDVKVSRDLIVAFEEAEDEKLIVAQEKVDKQERKEEEKQKKKAEKELERERNDEVKARKAEERKREKDEKELRFMKVAKTSSKAARSDAAGLPTSSDGPGLDNFFPHTKRGLPAKSSIKSKGKKAAPVVGIKVDVPGNNQWLEGYDDLSDDDKKSSPPALSSSPKIHETFRAPPSTSNLIPSIPTTRRKKSRSTSPLLDPPFAKKTRLSPVPSSPTRIASTSSLTTRILPAPRTNPTNSISSPPSCSAAKLSSKSSTASKQGLGTKYNPIVIEDSD